MVGVGVLADVDTGYPDFLAEMTSIGTLVAFLIVSIGVMVLRQRSPDLPRGFRVPLYPILPIASIAGCIWIIQDLRAVTIYVFFGWTAVALVWYFFYGIKHSKLGKAPGGCSASTARRASSCGSMRRR